MKLVINELLTYLFNHIGSYPNDSIRTIMLQFYGAEAIHTAKEILWYNYAECLDKCINRRGSSTKSVPECEVDDILNAMKSIDDH